MNTPDPSIVLPPPDIAPVSHGGVGPSLPGYYSAPTVRALLALERERAARLCEHYAKQHAKFGDFVSGVLTGMAAEIRKGEPA